MIGFWWSGYGLVGINYVTMLRLGSRLNMCRLEIRFGFAFLQLWLGCNSVRISS